MRRRKRFRKYDPPYNDVAKVSFFGGDTVGAYEWECVELSMRFMYLGYGINPYYGNGTQVVDNYNEQANPVLHRVPNDGSTKTVPVSGDILSYTSVDLGHTSVVTGSYVDSNGNGTITTIEQNASSNGTATLNVQNWIIQSNVKNWLHHTVDLAPQSGHSSTSVTIYGTRFSASERVTIYFDVTTLGTATTNSSGALFTTITIPSWASLGSHHLQIVGQTSKFSPATVLYVV